ncbi:universal stress protein [Paraburkholderia rhizosphaerae]|nr:universal stress protein [Paraburkholderia rhizosphaerae]
MEHILNLPSSGDITPTLPRRVTIAVDPSAASRQALIYARNILPDGAEVRLVSVAETPHSIFPLARQAGRALNPARQELLHDATETLEEAKQRIADSKFKIATELVDLAKHGGDVVSALVDAAHAWSAELLIVGTRQHHGLPRWVEGTVSGQLPRHLRCPVLIVPEACRTPIDHLPERILFAVDGSPQSVSALRYGVRFANRDTCLRSVYVIDDAVRPGDLVPDALEPAFTAEGKHALAAADKVLPGVSAQPTSAVLGTGRNDDDVAHAIVREADSWHAQLVVMGTHGRRGAARWILGSVAARVARITRTPLLLVHHDAPSRPGPESDRAHDA